MAFIVEILETQEQIKSFETSEELWKWMDDNTVDDFGTSKRDSEIHYFAYEEVNEEPFKDFWKNIPEDCVKAIKELKRMKVHRLAGYDNERTFADVWWCILHEVDMYAEGEYRAEDEPEERNYRLNLAQCQTADRWLVRWLDLFNKYKNPKEYSSEDFQYNGQVINGNHAW